MWGRVVAARASAISCELPTSRSFLPEALSLSANRYARLAPSSALLRCGNVSILATATPDVHLAVNFRQKAAAVGIIPLTWSRREQQPALREILTARLIDRSLRPLVPSAHLCVSVLATSRRTAPPLDALAVNVASASTAALPDWKGPIAAARVALVDGRLLPFPSETQLAHTQLSAFVAINNQQRILCLSVEAANVPRSLVQDAVAEAVRASVPLIALQNDFRDKILHMRDKEGSSSFPRCLPNQSEPQNENPPPDQAAVNHIQQLAFDIYSTAFVDCRQYPGKAHRAYVLTNAQQSLLDAFAQYSPNQVVEAAQPATRKAFRSVLFKHRVRADGRSLTEVRPLRAEASVLPGDVHGSAIFERGDTQVLAHATIGLPRRALKVEEYVEGADQRPFFVHYAFPSYATGEPGKLKTFSNRRELGHGALAEAAIAPVLDKCPYSLRVSAEVLASDGSSSMAAVCAGSMALRDAGAPITQQVAGVAMGLVSNSDEEIILTDILGMEDHFGEMDMKVTGTKDGLTACQLDTKRPDGLSQDTIANALLQASSAHLEILQHMIGQQKQDMPANAPRVIEIAVDHGTAVQVLLKNRALVLREIEDRTESKLFYDGKKQVVVIEAPSENAMQEARQSVADAVGDLEIGAKVRATVVDVRSSYAVVEIEGSAQGLLHVSKMMVNPIDGADRYPDARKVLLKGDSLDVVVIESNRSRNILRFGLTKTPARSVKLENGIDDILSAVAKSIGRVA